VAVSFLRTRVGSRRRESRAGQRLPSVPYRQRGVNDGQNPAFTRRRQSPSSSS
jgi:hypothetical protein